MNKGPVKWFNAEKATDSSQVKTDRMYSYTSPLSMEMVLNPWKKDRLYLMI